jgi:hypothetical protein
MLESMLLTLRLMSASMPEGCAVEGTVFHSTEQTIAQLHSDCLIDIQQHDRWIVMTAPQWVVAVEIPPTFGKGEFTYSWGSPWALFGAGPTTSEEWVPVAVGHRTGL